MLGFQVYSIVRSFELLEKLRTAYSWRSFVRPYLENTLTARTKLFGERFDRLLLGR
jgi:hypothetical protein